MYKRQSQSTAEGGDRTHGHNIHTKLRCMRRDRLVKSNRRSIAGAGDNGQEERAKGGSQFDQTGGIQPRGNDGFNYTQRCV